MRMMIMGMNTIMILTGMILTDTMLMGTKPMGTKLTGIRGMGATTITGRRILDLHLRLAPRSTPPL
jgi:hypothetical protein